MFRIKTSCSINQNNFKFLIFGYIVGLGTDSVLLIDREKLRSVNPADTSATVNFHCVTITELYKQIELLIRFYCVQGFVI